MITRYRMSIGGVQLDSCLDENEQYQQYKDSVVILDIGYSAPEFSRTVETAGEIDGGIITRTYRQKATVTVTFGLYIYDVADRFAVCQIIKSMLYDGCSITTNDRPGQILMNCVCEQYPEIDSARDWTAPITMVISSYAFPYWQEQEETIKSLTGKKTNSTVFVPGNATKAFAGVQIIANETFPTNVTPSTYVRVGGSFIRLTYPFKNGNCCVISYDKNNNLLIPIYSNSLRNTYIDNGLRYVHESSSDRLTARPGWDNAVSIEALGRITATFNVRGAWL